MHLIDRNSKVISLILAILFCSVALVSGLLPGVLFACLGYMSADALIKTRPEQRYKLSKHAANTVVIAAPLLILLFVLLDAKTLAINVIAQYASLMNHLASTVLDIRAKLPPSIAVHIPAEISAVQTIVSDYLKTQSSALTHFGKVWLEGLLLAYVGLIVGSLMRTSEKSINPAPLRQYMRMRGTNFIESFRQIVMAQFWIALFNTISTAIFLFAILPLMGAKLPYSVALVVFTFVASLLPVIGNLICNSVLALTGVSVAPWVGLVCLIFLMVIHKAEYLISAKVLGKKTNTAIWELLSVIFIGEILFGMIGLIAGPLYYTYIKRELQDEKLI